jgi:hypothetical protein
MLANENPERRPSRSEAEERSAPPPDWFIVYNGIGYMSPVFEALHNGALNDAYREWMVATTNSELDPAASLEIATYRKAVIDTTGRLIKQLSGFEPEQIRAQMQVSPNSDRLDTSSNL